MERKTILFFVSCSIKKNYFMQKIFTTKFKASYNYLYIFCKKLEYIFLKYLDKVVVIRFLQLINYLK